MGSYVSVASFPANSRMMLGPPSTNQCAYWRNQVKAYQDAQGEIL